MKNIEVLTILTPLLVFSSFFGLVRMRQDVERWRKSCLQCVKSAKGDMIPRPLGTELIPEEAGEVIMADRPE